MNNAHTSDTKCPVCGAHIPACLVRDPEGETYCSLECEERQDVAFMWHARQAARLFAAEER